MNIFYYFVLASLMIETVLAAFISFKVRRKLNHMHGMVLSMALGMNIGLTSGVLFGSLYQGNLFYSTLISMFIGVLSGLLCGISLGILSSIEGVMSGLMGGMMGAMLGAMVQASQSALLLNILLTFSICSLLLFLILPNTGSEDHNVYSKKWLFKPLITITVLASYLLFGYHLSKDTVYSKSNSNAVDDNQRSHGQTEKKQE